MTSYWSSEAATIPASQPRFSQLEFDTHKLIGLSYASSELVADAPTLGAYLTRAFGADMGFKLDATLISGTGAGLPMGVLASPALVTVAKDIGQAAATLTTTNIDAMWNALPAPCRRRAVWLVNEVAESQLSGTSETANAMYSPQGAGGNEYALLKGRPVIPIEQGKPLGQIGDILLVDPTQIVIVDRGFRAEASAHFDFLKDQVIFRFVWRIDARPLWVSPIVSASDGVKRSPYVALAAR